MPSNSRSRAKRTEDEKKKRKTGTDKGTIKTPETPTKISSKRKSSKSLSHVSKPSPLTDTPLGSFLSPFRPVSTQWVSRYVFVSFALILRAAVGLGPYSGLGAEPLHGDFEAQRHWMEITLHLPISEWYFYDLQWWGLDYPPLTAYHSWLLGAIGSAIGPHWFELFTSRGSDQVDLKSYMRATVLFSELFIYIPAVISFVRYGKKLTAIDQSIAAAAILFQPALILIDHGHFQYNSVMLGLTLLSVVNLCYDNLLTAAFLFVLSLSFKQMALYYAPVMFAYMLAVCLGRNRPPPQKSQDWVSFSFQAGLKLIPLGVTVVLTFALMFAPLFLSGGIANVAQSIARIFPFSRGIWEDKVASFWCTANTVIKFRTLVSAAVLQKFSLLATLLSIFPPSLAIFLFPKKHLLPWAFSACSWGFFFFSFQVHEKSVLLPLMPVTLLLSSTDANVISMVSWVNNIATFSLWPLLHREGLTLQYAVMLLCWNWLIGFRLPNNIFLRMSVVLSYLAAISLHAIEYYRDPPLNLPDLWVIGNITISFGSFFIFWLWLLLNIYKRRHDKD